MAVARQIAHDVVGWKAVEHRMLTGIVQSTVALANRSSTVCALVKDTHLNERMLCLARSRNVKHEMHGANARDASCRRVKRHWLVDYDYKRALSQSCCMMTTSFLYVRRLLDATHARQQVLSVRRLTTLLPPSLVAVDASTTLSRGVQASTEPTPDTAAAFTLDSFIDFVIFHNADERTHRPLTRDDIKIVRKTIRESSNPVLQPALAWKTNPLAILDTFLAGDIVLEYAESYLMYYLLKAFPNAAPRENTIKSFLENILTYGFEKQYAYEFNGDELRQFVRAHADGLERTFTGFGRRERLAVYNFKDMDDLTRTTRERRAIVAAATPKALDSLDFFDVAYHSIETFRPPYSNVSVEGTSYESRLVRAAYGEFFANTWSEMHVTFANLDQRHQVRTVTTLDDINVEETWGVGGDEVKLFLYGEKVGVFLTNEEDEDFDPQNPEASFESLPDPDQGDIDIDGLVEIEGVEYDDSLGTQASISFERRWIPFDELLDEENSAWEEWRNDLDAFVLKVVGDTEGATSKRARR